MRGHALVSVGRVRGLSYYFLLGSIPNGADAMVEVVSLFLHKYSQLVNSGRLKIP